MQAAFRTKRPVDKSIKAINDTVPEDTQKKAELLVVTTPCTVTGFRWDLRLCTATNDSAASAGWALIITRAGNDPVTLNMGQNSDVYTPQQHVIASGLSLLPGPNAEGVWNCKDWKGHTKTARKLMVGDKLVLIYRNTSGSVANVDVTGQVQFICRF